MAEYYRYYNEEVKVKQICFVIFPRVLGIITFNIFIGLKKYDKYSLEHHQSNIANSLATLFFSVAEMKRTHVKEVVRFPFHLNSYYSILGGNFKIQDFSFYPHLLCLLAWSKGLFLVILQR